MDLISKYNKLILKVSKPFCGIVIFWYMLLTFSLIIEEDMKLSGEVFDEIYYSYCNGMRGIWFLLVSTVVISIMILFIKTAGKFIYHRKSIIKTSILYYFESSIVIAFFTTILFSSINGLSIKDFIIYFLKASIILVDFFLILTMLYTRFKFIKRNKYNIFLYISLIILILFGGIKDIYSIFTIKELSNNILPFIIIMPLLVKGFYEIGINIDWLKGE